MLKVFIFVFTALYFPLSFGDIPPGFEGRFQGEGDAIFRSGRDRSCSEIFLHYRYDRDEQKIKALNGGYVCQDLQASYPLFALDVKEGELFSNGRKVGNINSHQMQFGLYDPSDDSHFSLTLSQEGEGLHYLEVWKSAGEKALVVEGHLLKQP